MRFNLAILAGLAAITNAVAIPEAQPEGQELTNIMVSDGITDEVFHYVPETEDALEKRQRARPGVSMRGGASGQAGQVLGRAIAELLRQLFPIQDWTPARERFTQATTALMWQNNPNPSVWVAVACYNKAWDVRDRSRVTPAVSVRLTLGALNTDYDCMYIGRNNQFWTRGDNGFINLSYTYNGNVCSHDRATGDLTCN